MVLQFTLNQKLPIHSDVNVVTLHVAEKSNYNSHIVTAKHKKCLQMSDNLLPKTTADSS